MRILLIAAIGILIGGVLPAGPVPGLETVKEEEVTFATPPSVRVTQIGDDLYRCRFVVKPTLPTQKAWVAGSFNFWNATANPMEGPDGAGQFTVALDLHSGEHQYKYVLDGSRWVPDPANPTKMSDQRGGFNSVLRLGIFAVLDGRTPVRGDGRIEPAGLLHDPGRARFVDHETSGVVTIRLQTLKDDVQQVWLQLGEKDRVEMRVTASAGYAEYYECKVPEVLFSGAPTYTFVLSDAPTREAPAPVNYPKTYSTTFDESRRFATPDWAKHAIWYQIMPERFRDGDAANNPEGFTEWKMDWAGRGPTETKADFPYPVYRRYGGDLRGIIDKLDYLKGLGITAIYLTPVFQSTSAHKYDAIDYRHVDDRLGVAGEYARIMAQEDLLQPLTWKWSASDMVLLELIRECHRRGIRIVLDAVLNHVSTDHPAFQDLLKNGKASPYADWFEVKSWDPLRYEGWSGYDRMPVFRKGPDGIASKSLREHLFAITRRWMDPDGDGNPADGIDGWRLDVANEIAPPFWREWRQVVKSVNKDAYTSAEIWDPAEEWLDGRTFDAVMNYPFAKNSVHFFIDEKQKLKASQFDAELRHLRVLYPREATQVLMNLFDSHDTDRIVTRIMNPDRPYDGENNPAKYPTFKDGFPPAWAYDRLKLMAMFQMTFGGAPMIYYGTEAGMWGADDPGCRKPMLWSDLGAYDNPSENQVRADLLKEYQELTALRQAHPALSTGDFLTLATLDEQDVYAYARSNGDEAFLVVLNNSRSEQSIVGIRLPADDVLPAGPYTPVHGTARLAFKNGVISGTMPPLSGIVFSSGR